MSKQISKPLFTVHRTVEVGQIWEDDYTDRTPFEAAFLMIAQNSENSEFTREDSSVRYSFHFGEEDITVDVKRRIDN